ncbi:MAG: hypothetical protein WCT02_02275, partial [Candidatus Paceibacterota bacterium]
MSSNKAKLPRIMYDQSQFTAIYFIGKNGLWLNESMYEDMGKISGYAPEAWVTYTQNLPESFFFGAYEDAALEREGEVGLKNFSDPEFLTEFENATKQSYQMTVELKNHYFKELYGWEKKVVQELPEKVIDFISQVQKVNSFITSYYFLTQPQRFYKFEEELKKQGLNKDTELISTNGRSLTYVSELRKVVLEYAEQVLKAGIGPEKFKIKNSSEYKSLLKAVNDLGFLNWGLLGGDFIDAQYIDKEVENLVSDKIKLKEEKSKMDAFVSAVKNRNDLVKSNSTKAYKLADIMGHASVLRFDLQTCTLCILKYVDNLLKEVMAKYDMSENEIKSYEFDEILELIKNGQKISQDLVLKRQRGFLRIYEQEGVKTYIAEDAHKEIAQLLEFRKSEVLETKSLKGA